MLFSVPQYIDVEDKIAGPLTVKQFLWTLGLGAVLIVLWNIFATTAFYVVAVPTTLLFAALAFYKPHGVPLITFIGYGITFLFQPKVYVWRRMPDATKKVKRAKAEQAFRTQFYKQETRVNRDDLAAIAATLDSEGARVTDRMEEILQNRKRTRKR